MTSFIRLIWPIILIVSFSFAQVKMNLSTDKINYNYGEVIELKVSVFNDTDSSISFFGDVLNPIELVYMNVDLLLTHSTADGVIEFDQGVVRTWIFEIDPEIAGLPVETGEQVITVNAFGIKKTIKFFAPEFSGGRIQVHFYSGVSQNTKDWYRSGIGALIVSSEGEREIWQVEKYDIDSLSLVLKSKHDIIRCEPYRIIELPEQIITSIPVDDEIPSDYSLKQNFPNPFNPSTKIKFSVPYTQHVRINIYNILGEKISTLIDNEVQPGNYEVTFNGKDSSSGIYFYELVTDDFSDIKKMLLLK